MHFEARDQAKAQEKKPTPEPKKRGCKSKVEKEAYEKQKQEVEAKNTVFEKSNVFWYGFKDHLAVGTQSQYILQSMMSSGNLNDGKASYLY